MTSVASESLAMKDPGVQLTADEQKRQSVLLELMRVATSSLDVSEAFKHVSNLVGELVPHDRMSVSLRPDEEDYMEVYVLRADHEKGQRVFDRGQRLPLAASTAGRAFVTGRPAFKRLPEEASNPADLALADAGYRGLLAVLLRADGRLIGTLNFGSHQPDAYSEREAEVAQEVADHLASPIEHAYLGTRLMRQAEELRLVNEISTAVYQATSIYELFERAHERLRALTGMEAGAVLLLDEERQVLDLAYEQNMPRAAIDSLATKPLPVGQFIPGIVTERCQMMVVVDADRDERQLPSLRNWGVKTHVCIPLAVGGRALGVIGLVDRTLHSFSQSELALFATVGEQLGMAVERSRLMDRQAQLLERQRFLNELMRIAVSSLDVRDIFDSMADKIRGVIPFDWFYIALPVPGEESFEVFASSQSTQFPQSLVGHVPLSDGPSGEVISRGEPIIVDELGKCAQWPRAVQVAEETGLRSCIFLPLVSKGRVFGSLNFFHFEAGHFTQRDLQTASEIADHISVLIEHALLFQDSKEIAKLQERTRLANEIHDSLAQAFIGVILELDLAEKMSANDPAGAREEMARARQMAQHGLEESRRSVLALRPSSLEDSSLAEAVTREFKRLSNDGVSVEVAVTGTPYPLAEEVETDVFRVAQEIAANIRKHAGATNIAARLAYDDHAFKLTVSDDGAGFDLRNPGGGFGLATMRDRARKIGGELSIDSARDRGTRVTLRVPQKRTGAEAPPEIAPRIRVLLADDHAVARHGIRRMLEVETDIEVVSEATDGEEALAKARSLKPDVVIADVRMPGMSGVELVKTLTDEAFPGRAIILTAHLDGDLIARAMKAGAQGYLLKDLASNELAQAVRAVQRGETYLQREAAGELARRVRAVGEGEIVERLTGREREVLGKIVRGLRNKEIARTLGITEATVKFHVAHIFEKLGVGSRAEAVGRALKLGITEPDESGAPK